MQDSKNLGLASSDNNKNDFDFLNDERPTSQRSNKSGKSISSRASLKNLNKGRESQQNLGEIPEEEVASQDGGD